MSLSNPRRSVVSVSSRSRLGQGRIGAKSLISLRLGAFVLVPAWFVSVWAKSLILRRLGVVSLVVPPKGGKGRGPEPPPLSPSRSKMNACRMEK